MFCTQMGRRPWPGLSWFTLSFIYVSQVHKQHIPDNRANSSRLRLTVQELIISDYSGTFRPEQFAGRPVSEDPRACYGSIFAKINLWGYLNAQSWNEWTEFKRNSCHQCNNYAIGIRMGLLTTACHTARCLYYPLRSPFPNINDWTHEESTSGIQPAGEFYVPW